MPEFRGDGNPGNHRRPPGRPDSRQGRSDTMTNKVRLIAVAIKIADNPIGVSLSNRPWTHLPAKPMQF
jgi:hypothetical protein